MNHFVITTDNCCDLPKEYLEEHGIGCCFLTYEIDGVSYQEENFLQEHEFYEKMRNGSMPTTAQVNPDAVRRMMEPYLKAGKDILHIAFSSGLSGSYNSVLVAAEELMEEYPGSMIQVVDSLAASLGQGFLVDLAVQKREEGMELAELASWLKEKRNHVVHAFTVNDLFHLFRGGRVSRTTAIVGSMLNIKPMLHVDAMGKLVNVSKARGRKKSLHMLVDMMDQKIGSYKDTCDTIFVSHGDCLEDAQYVVELVKKKYPVKRVVVNYVNSTIGAHSGPGTVALFFLGDEK